MPKKVFFGNEYEDGILLLLGLIMLLAVVGALAALAPPLSTELLTQCGAVAAGAGLGCAVRVWMIARTRRWLSATDTGFTMEEWGSTWTVSDEEVTDLGLVERTIVDQGGATITHRKVRLAFATPARAETLEFEQWL